MQIIRVQLKIKNIDKWNNSKYEYSFLKRLKLVKKIIKNETKAFKDKNKILFLFPAGMFKVPKNTLKIFMKKIENYISSFLRLNKLNICIVIGIDTISNIQDEVKLVKKGIFEEQVSVAITKKGIISAARKFHPTDEEKGKIKLSKSFNSKNFGYKRYFKYANLSFCMAVCYDIFGIRKENVKITNGTVILNLIHMFSKSGKGSGVFYYVRDGLARTSYHILSKVFCAAVFEKKSFNNYVSGVNIKKQVNMKWKYKDSNHYTKTFETKYENVLVRIDSHPIRDSLNER